MHKLHDFCLILMRNWTKIYLEHHCGNSRKKYHFNLINKSKITTTDDGIPQCELKLFQ